MAEVSNDGDNSQPGRNGENNMQMVRHSVDGVRDALVEGGCARHL
jgi:hypothetical protein